MNIQEPTIINLPAKKLVGKKISTTLAENSAFELWSSFMPRVKEISNRKGQELFSVQVYDSNLTFKDFNRHSVFQKWAAAEVTDFDQVPPGLETCTLEGGLYAVFIHKGLPEHFAQTAAYIFGEWLPASGFELDNREHFEVMGTQYRHADPGSEEEVWIPIKPCVEKSSVE